MNQQPLFKTGPVAIYARFSSQLQNERSIEDQIRRAREYISQQGGMPDAAKVFADYAVSGSSLDRRGFEAMMLEVDGGSIKVIVTEDMSRISHPVLLDTERRITDAGVESISSGVLPIGTVLMSSRAPVGYLAIAGVPTAINQGFIGMVCDGPLPPVFILNWAVSSMDTIKAHASGTTFPEISKGSFRPLLIVQPSADAVFAYQRTSDSLFSLLTTCIKESEQLAEVRDYLLPRLLSGSVRATHD